MEITEMFDFTLSEIVDLSVSVLALTLALTIVSLDKGIVSVISQPFAVIYYFIIFFLVITPAFILHEMGHRFTAKKYGAKAHYKGFPFWIIFMMLGAIFFGVVFAATGAVVIFAHYLTSKERAEISLAGPKVNIILAILFILSSLVFIPISKLIFLPVTITNITAMFFEYSAYINAFLATFNLIPMVPLDGSKIISYSFMKWAKWFGIAMLLLLLIQPASIMFILVLVIFSLLISTLHKGVGVMAR